GPALPHTGGIGRDQILLAGALTVLLAAAGYGTHRVRSRGNRGIA
ncbi:MAG: LPXTG cell wall anchor domain-containing protein, partial [Propionibacterium sp.]|nr:LPXTG cell wall anchor domain-containing protein [Propionibacterium sp.]